MAFLDPVSVISDHSLLRYKEGKKLRFVQLFSLGLVGIQFYAVHASSLNKMPCEPNGMLSKTSGVSVFLPVYVK